MTNNLFKKITTLLVTLSLVVGVMTGFSSMKTVEAEATDEKIKVYYAFDNLHDKASFDEIAKLEYPLVIFVPATLGIDFDKNPCLPTIPAGSARLVVADYNSGKTSYDKETVVSDTDPSSGTMNSDGELPSEQTGYLSGNAYPTYAKVITVQPGKGFDTCASGGLYDIGNDLKYVYYGCSGGGVKGLKGNVVYYKEAEVSLNAVNAMVKPEVEIPSGTAFEIRKDHIKMSFTVEGQNYMVPENLNDNDYHVDPDNDEVFIPAPGSSEPLDDDIDVFFGTTKINVKVHIHDWTYSTNAEGDTLYAECQTTSSECPLAEKPMIKLVVTDKNVNGVDEFGNPIKACGYEKNSAWNYVAGDSIVIKYKNLDKENATETTELPTKKGNYRASLKVDGSDGVTYEIAKEFFIDKDGNVTESSQHVHQWKYTIGENGTLLCECISKYETCPYSSTYQITADVTGGEYGTGEDYTGTGIVQMGQGEITDEDLIEALEMPEPSTVKYIKYQTENDSDGNPKLDEDGNVIYVLDTDGNPIVVSESEDRPEGQGGYVVVQVYENPDGGTVEVSTPFNVFTGKDKYGNPLEGKFSVDVPYRYVYPGTGIDYTKGWLYYTTAQVNAATEPKDKEAVTAHKYNFVKIDDEIAARDPLYNYAECDGQKYENIYIDMYTEHLVVPRKVAAYRLTSTGKWENKELDDAALKKAIDKNSTQISITFEALGSNGKPSGKVYTFKKIAKRENCDNIKVNYLICADRTGKTNGQFILLNNNNRPLYNCSDKYDVTFASLGNAKDPATVGWGKWPSTGGVWVPDIPKNEDGTPGTKTAKFTFFVRKTAVDTGSQFKPASKVKKVSVSSVQKAVAVKADYKKEILKLKKDVVAYFGNEIIDITKADFDSITKNFATYTYAVTKAASAASAASVSYESLDVSFTTLMKDFRDQAEFADYEDMIIDFNNDISPNADLKKNGIDISGYLTPTRNTVMVWQKATDKKPASITAPVKFAKRGVIDSAVEALVKVDESKHTVALTKLGSSDPKINLEVEVPGRNNSTSWKSALPKFSGDLATAGALSYQIGECIYPIRIKADAKGGKEADTSNAAGVTRYILVTYKDFGTGRSKKIGIDTVQFFDTMEAATAAKKIVEEVAAPAAK